MCHARSMLRSACTTRFWVAVGSAALAIAPLGCTGAKDAPALSKIRADSPIPKVPEPPRDGPKLGSIADVTPVYDRPESGAKQIGYLHAGGEIARAAKPYSRKDCSGGWYPVRPRGFVCVGPTATLDLSHPTLAAMSLAPKLDQTLPYVYARVLKDTPLYDRDPKLKDTVREIGKLPNKSGLAIVGSWEAKDPGGQLRRLAMTTNGHFVRAADLEPAQSSSFHGVELGAKQELPIAFVVKRGVHEWRLDKDGDAQKLGLLDYHALVPLTGHFHTLGPNRYWTIEGDRFVRYRDVTVIRRRNVFPSFATGTAKWIDVSIVTGTLVAYEGKKAIFATLVSVGRDRLGDPKTSHSTAQGEFQITGKHVTGAGLNPKSLADNVEIFDAPWVMELSSGQMMLGAYWHDRFGIEHGPGNLELSPADAARIWHWATPDLPEGWYGVTQPPPDGEATIVHVRK
jgi:hypothetical protein